MRVLVAGAGLAGLAAARALTAQGAEVIVIEARDRVGGRVVTIRDGFGRQHAEGGADLIDADHTAVLDLARELGLRTVRTLRGGFKFYGATRDGRPAVQPLGSTFGAIHQLIAAPIREYQLAEQRWDGPIAARFARESVAAWLTRTGADPWLVERVRGLRGLFLADPEDLSLLALVDFFAAASDGPGHSVRIRDGNDRLPAEMAARLATPPRLHTILRRVRQRAQTITATVETNGRMSEIAADYLVSALPASTLRDVVFDPALAEPHQRAIGQLRYGAATRVLLQFDRAFWRKPGQPSAYGSDQPTGAVWDGNEHQRGPAGILSLLAGGGASASLQQILAAGGSADVVARLRWLGRPARLLASKAIAWEQDRWAKGGYAYFDPSFDPRWRDVLARPSGRVVFAGEHTHNRWQGYMNGAVESGFRAAAEIRVLSTS